MTFYIKLTVIIFLIFKILFPSSLYAFNNNIKVLQNISYGKHQKQTLDIYLPKLVKNAPVIFMVHGGAWKIGDKSAKAVVKNKVAYWVNKGFIFISVNYRLLPEADPILQASDVIDSIKFSQNKVEQLGGSSNKFILMGHSAGAHLVSLISSNKNTIKTHNVKPWLGTIALDSAAYNIVDIMDKKRPSRLYKKAFGENKTFWLEASPFHQLSEKLFPFLAICSSKRKDDSCNQAQRYIEKAKKFKTSAYFLKVNYSHRDINLKLGKDSCYTQVVNKFIAKLHPSIKTLLKNNSTFENDICSGYTLN